MKQVNIHDAKTHLSEYLADLKPGEEIILCRRNVPVAKIVSLQPKKQRKPLGLGKGTLAVSDAFFEPLDDETLALYEGSESRL